MLPSLNERGGDIQLLAEHYLKGYSSRSGRPALAMAPDFIKQLTSHTWKGNIRELKNLIERAVIIADSDQLTVDLLPFNFTGDKNSSIEIFEMSAMEKKHIAHILKYTNGNKMEAARLLNIGLTTLYRKIDEYHLG
jgi:DNA-binding NtrC family response regulator